MTKFGVLSYLFNIIDDESGYWLYGQFGFSGRDFALLTAYGFD
jgi:hypothetical protein